MQTAIQCQSLPSDTAPDDPHLQQLAMWSISRSNHKRLGMCLNRWILRYGLGKTSTAAVPKDCLQTALLRTGMRHTSDQIDSLLGYSTAPLTRWTLERLAFTLAWLELSALFLLVELGVRPTQELGETPVSRNVLTLLDSFHLTPQEGRRVRINHEVLRDFGAFVQGLAFQTKGSQRGFAMIYGKLNGLSLATDSVGHSSSASVLLSNLLKGKKGCWTLATLQALADFAGLELNELPAAYADWQADSAKVTAGPTLMIRAG